MPGETAGGVGQQPAGLGEVGLTAAPAPIRGFKAGGEGLGVVERFLEREARRLREASLAP